MKKLFAVVIAILVLNFLIRSIYHSVTKEDKYAAPSYHVNNGKNEIPTAVREFLTVRRQACKGQGTLEDYWEGIDTASRVGGINGKSMNFRGVTNYAHRCTDPDYAISSGREYQTHKLHYHVQSQKYMLGEYSLAIKQGTDENLCDAEILGWTDPYHAKIYGNGYNAETLVRHSADDYMNAQCIMNLSKDGTMSENKNRSYTERDAEICRLHLGRERNKTPYYYTVQTVDIKMRFPGTGKEHIWSMYYRHPPWLDKQAGKKDGWALLEVDKNYCMPYNENLQFWTVAQSLGANWGDYIVDQFHPEWLRAYWRRIGVRNEVQSARDNGYKPGDDYHHPMGKWYYTVDSPYHGKL